MQLCPAWEKAWSFALSAAVSQSPSEWTISGALEPSSRLTFLWGTRLRIPQPTPAEPVKLSARGQLVLDDRVADLRAGPGDDAQPALRQARLEQHLGQLQRRDRRLAGRLQHDRVAGGDRRPQLVGDQVEREVEGADRADHAVGDAQHHPELAHAGGRGLHRHRAAGQLARLDGGEGEGVDAARRLRPGGLQRLARLGGDRQGEVVEPLADQLRGPVEHRGARVLGEVRALEGRLRRPRGAIDQRRVALGDPPHDRPVVGAADLVPLAGRHPLAGREELVIDRLDCLRGHENRVVNAGRDSPIQNLLTQKCAFASQPPCFFLLLAPAAQARVTWVVHGHGFGHGVGMSQYGAFGYAKHGRDYRSILGHYYTGTRIAPLAGPRVVRVLLDISRGDVGFGGRRRPAAERSPPSAATRPTAAARRFASAPPAASRSPTAAGSCARPAAVGSRSPASAPTAARSRWCRPAATPAPSTSSTRCRSTST